MSEGLSYSILPPCYCHHKFPGGGPNDFAAGSSKRERERDGKNVIVARMARRNHILFHWTPGARFVATRPPLSRSLTIVFQKCFSRILQSHPFPFLKTTRLKGGCAENSICSWFRGHGNWKCSPVDLLIVKVGDPDLGMDLSKL
ncbi:hypothetical protein AVEN_29434-1 [Araneus ventricosus]|uniref:Uncharacterized protein n=1 Tax=Araneus ventricosus TaxID=182803 RepID=A0A4Y2CYW5_ARAVE|nr:hypothetical protein AVEN_29434-1 [Araneus ventricosus]